MLVFDVLSGSSSGTVFRIMTASSHDSIRVKTLNLNLLCLLLFHDPRSKPQQMSYGSLNRPTRRSVPPDVPSSAQPPFMAQPISSRISIPPNTTLSRQNKPIPLSVILRLQNPRWGAMRVRHPRAGGGEGERGGHQSAPPPQREYVRQPPVQVEQQAPPAAYSDGKSRSPAF